MEKRGDLGKEACNLLKIIFEKDYLILFPNIVYRELAKFHPDDEISGSMRLLYFSGRLIKSRLSKGEINEARMLQKARALPIGDCLIVVHAQKRNAVVVTQDKHILEELSDIVLSKRPREIS
jgi:rRNA-processing protein FCF1